MFVLDYWFVQQIIWNPLWSIIYWFDFASDSVHSKLVIVEYSSVRTGELIVKSVGLALFYRLHSLHELSELLQVAMTVLSRQHRKHCLKYYAVIVIIRWNLITVELERYAT